MREILEERTLDLAQRTQYQKRLETKKLLSSHWPQSEWLFELESFTSLLAGPLIAAPGGVTLRGFPVTGFVMHGDDFLPVLSWTTLAQLSQPKSLAYLASERRGLALEISADCSLVEEPAQSLEDTDARFSRGKYIGTERLLADTELIW